ncbi:zinc ribbon domain-containing protein [Neobacillus vireti]|uniref:DZANK-type domain-containing protein n=1 Tax=Neobacillus vireti LMG 21834 TaxID=1131730 RepID=A0AB94IJ58_9BACI|nr:zinc ribbon domain-containing protein [Neobacillus vireti]ETI67050.1 hypothetical protein BAVI_19529 [Neobacillus vireti LMG 21834]
MIKCISCHQEIEKGKFCGYCGASQVCLQCEHELSETSIFCSNCGAKRNDPSHLDHMSAPPVSQPNPFGPGYMQPIPASPNSGHLSDSIKIWINKIGKRNLYIIGGIIIALIVVVNMLNGGNSPKKVVENFIKAVDAGNMKKAAQYVDPKLPWNANAASKPAGASIKIRSIVEMQQTEDYAKLKVEADMKPKPLRGNPETIIFELKKINGKWYISDMD